MSNKVRKIVIYGAGTLGLIVEDMLKQEGWFSEELILIDDDPEKSVFNYDESKHFFPSSEYDIVIAIGYENLDNRLSIYQKVRKDGYRLRSIVHSEACINTKAVLGDGCIIMEKTVVGMNAVLSDIVVMWSGSIVSHDSIIGSNTFLSPNSTICGFAEVGSNSFIGAGAIVVDRAILSSNSFVKAGVVVK